MLTDYFLKEVSGGISAADSVDFYTDDFGWKVNRWLHPVSGARVIPDTRLQHADDSPGHQGG
jgi:hypothetical protein